MSSKQIWQKFRQTCTQQPDGDLLCASRQARRPFAASMLTRVERAVFEAIGSLDTVRVSSEDGHRDLLGQLSLHNAHLVTKLLKQRHAVVAQQNSDGIVPLRKLRLALLQALERLSGMRGMM